MLFEDNSVELSDVQSKEVPIVPLGRLTLLRVFYFFSPGRMFETMGSLYQ